MTRFDELVSTVQRNCHVSDARYAGNYSMCIFLLKMREYFRWERGYAPDASLPQEEVGEWLQARERLWEGLEHETFTPLSIADRELDPFDSSEINRLLLPEQLVYSGGYGRFAKPLFFLGRLVKRETVDDFTVLVTDDEYARDLAAPPAMTQQRTLYIRRAAIRQMLWEGREAWQWRPQEGAMARALAFYGLTEGERALENLEQMTDAVLELVKEHELGEAHAGALLGPDWEALLMEVAATRGEVVMRAIRDHLADALRTLPRLLAEESEGLWHYYAANLTGMRQELLPGFAPAYRQWLESGRTDALEEFTARARDHWIEACQGLLARYREDPDSVRRDLQECSEGRFAIA